MLLWPTRRQFLRLWFLGGELIIVDKSNLYSEIRTLNQQTDTLEKALSASIRKWTLLKDYAQSDSRDIEFLVNIACNKCALCYYYLKENSLLPVCNNCPLKCIDFDSYDYLGPHRIICQQLGSVTIDWSVVLEAIDDMLSTLSLTLIHNIRKELSPHTNWAFGLDEKKCSRENQALYHLIKDLAVVTHINNDYAHADYRIVSNPYNLTNDELALIADEGNLCFGYRMKGSDTITIHTD